MIKLDRFRQFLFGTLRGRLILAVASVHAAMMTLFIVDLTKRQRDMIRARQVDQAIALSQALATSAAEWIAADDLAGLREIVETQRRYPELEFAFLTDENGRVQATLGPTAPGSYVLDLPAQPRQTVLSRTAALVDVATPAMLGDRHVGWARVGIGQSRASARLSLIVWNGVGYGLAAVLLGSIIAWYMGRRISRRLYTVQETIAEVRSGHRNARSSMRGTDEAAEMACEFNAMLDALEQRDRTVQAGEQALTQINRELRAIRKCSQAMVRADDEASLLNQVCRIICDEAGYALALVGFVEQDQAQTIRPVARAGRDTSYVDQLKVSWSDHSEHGQGPGGIAIRSGEPVYVQDVSMDARMAPWREAALRRNYLSLIALPLIDDNKPFGVLTIYSSTKGAFTPAEQQLLQELADDLGFGLRSLRARHAQKEADRAVYEAQAMFRSLVENSPDVIARYGRDCVRTYVNPTYLKVAQLPERELLGTQPVRYSPLPSDGAAVLQGLLRRVLDTGVAEAIDVPWPKANGEPRWFNIYAFAEPDRNGNVDSVMTISRDISNRKNAEAALAESEERYRTIFEHSPLGIFRSTLQGQFIEVNPALAGMLGYASADEVIRNRCTVFEEAIRASGASASARHLNRYKRKNGEEFLANLYLTAVRSPDGAPVFLEGIVEDVTETHFLEAQLRQAQKMEAVGRLAGGVAHDFNNMLGVILGQTEMALDEPDLSPFLRATLREVRVAAERSATLTRQLLAFARKQTVAPRLLDLNTTVAGMISMLRRLIGEDIHLSWSPAAYPCMVDMDPAQVDQILANLSVNARDAITGVGSIVIETARVTIDEVYPKGNVDIEPGTYIQLSVSDNGCGMDKETVGRLFEPFFTTKEPGKGTGLGLATVYGIVRQNHGFVNVYSEPGQGTTFRVYLPAKVQGEEKTMDETTTSPQSGRETVLVVEDEPAILRMATQFLERLGYRVLPASTPGEAIRIANAHAAHIDLLVTDVVMPEMNGRQLADALVGMIPGLRCLFMSGYTNDVIAHHGVLDDGIEFIAKPFNTTEFAKKIRTILDGKAATI